MFCADPRQQLSKDKQELEATMLESVRTETSKALVQAQEARRTRVSAVFFLYKQYLTAVLHPIRPE